MLGLQGGSGVSIVAGFMFRCQRQTRSCSLAMA